MSKVVIVEDDIPLAEMYKFKLDGAGFVCEIALDGAAGLELIKNSKPDLVLLDLMLPQMTGGDVLKHMRGSQWGKNIKVIVLTNVSEAEAPDELRKLGIERYLVKANNTPSQVIEFVNQALGAKPA